MMESIKAVFLQFFRQHFRDKYSVFWSLLFPLVLMSILVLIFGSFEEGGEIVFNVSLVNLEESEHAGERDVSQIIEDVFTEADADEERNWLQLFRSDIDENPEEFLLSEKKLLEERERHAVLVIPEGFNSTIEDNIRYEFIQIGDEPNPAELTLYRNPENQISMLAGDIISGIISGINRETNVKSGLVNTDELMEIRKSHIETSAETGDFSMVDYLLPGIILMTFLSSGMEMFVEKLSSLRERGVLRRFFATPLHPANYFGGLFTFIVFMSVIQVLLIYVWGRVFFGFDINIFTLSSLAYMVFALLVFMVMGFLVISLSHSAESTGAITQALVYPLMFMGGLFFPVMGFPGLLRVIVLANPVTYLINGLRNTLGVYPSPTSFYLNIGVPALWIAAGLIISAYKFNWNPEGEK